jgi:ankyrin repeat protein
MKNPYIIPAAMVCATILAVIWMLKSPSEQPQKVMIVQPPQPPDISIHDAARTGNIEAVKQHLAAGTDVNKKIKGGWTPLHLAVAGGRKEIVELLIAAGVDVNGKDEDGETPLDWAIIANYSETAVHLFDAANLLRKHGGKTKKEL